MKRNMLLSIATAVLAITHIHRKRRLPCRPDSADLERRRRIRAGFPGEIKE